MSSFTDAGGRKWQVDVNVGVVKSCRELLDFDVCELPGSFETVQRLRTDDVLLANLIYLCCQKQAEEAGVSDEDFGEMLAGEVIAAAEEALWDSLHFFFRGNRREQLAKALEIQTSAEREVIEQLTPQRTEAVTKRIGTEAGRIMDQLIMEDSTSDA